MITQQHKRATPVAIKVIDTVMIQVPTRASKLASKFVGPHLVVGEKHSNKVEVYDPFLKTVNISQSDRLKKMHATDANLAE